MKDIVILSWHDLSSAYSCLLYLGDSLVAKNIKVEIRSKTNLKRFIQETNSEMISFLNTWYGNFRKVRYLLVQIDVFIDVLKNPEKLYIINDWDFFLPLYFAKKLNNKVKVVHYNTEIAGEDVKSLKLIQKFYRKHANFPNMIVECLNERALWRQKVFDIHKSIYVINNTLPLHFATNSEPINGRLTSLCKFQNNNPILIYAGGASLSRQITEIIDCVDRFKDTVNFLFFCYGDDKTQIALLNYINSKCHYQNYKFSKAIARTELFKIMQNCDIGVNFYNPDISINHKYAAPGKFFEYMACGLNILTTNNEGINHIVEDNEIGVCIKNTESIGDALQRLLDKGLQEKSYIQSLFKSRYCYENDSSITLNEIHKLLL